METLRLDDSSAGIEKTAEILRSGGIAAIPTETVYGLAANAFDPAAVEKIFTAKGRPADNPLIVHIASKDDLCKLARDIPEEAFRLAELFWPGPLTLVLKKSNSVPDIVSGGLDTIAVRMPAHPVALKVIQAADIPLAAPSANRSGSPSPTSAQHCIDDLDVRIDAVLDGGNCEIGLESTVLSLAGEAPVLLRPGKITPERIENVIGDILLSKAVLEEIPDGEKAESPGMKYRHYAPKAKVVLVRSCMNSFVQSLCKKIQEYPMRRYAVLCFDGEEKYMPADAVAYGHRGDFEEQARRLFDALRRLDALECDEIYVRAPIPVGVGLAVYNRLLRAAAFDVVYAPGKPVLIGITGSSGAGKSTVRDILAEQNIPVIDADHVARRVLYKGSHVYRLLVGEFGNGILDEKKNIDRKALAAIAFSDPVRLRTLNSITHPEIIKRIRAKIRYWEKKSASYLILDAPLLLESKLDFLCDYVIAVTAAETERLERLRTRDSLPDDAIRARLTAQHPDSFYIKSSDFVIHNNFGIKELETAVLTIFAEIKGDISENFSRN